MCQESIIYNLEIEENVVSGNVNLIWLSCRTVEHNCLYIMLNLEKKQGSVKKKSKIGRGD